jgi:hypothetical protein
MNSSFLRSCLSILTADLFLSPSCFPLETHLSEEAVREAYFLGQHHDKSVTDFLGKYIQLLPVPETGPQIASVAFYTPFALLVQSSNERSFNYSAQQAELDHRGKDESVKIVIQIQLTPDYGPTIAVPTGSRSGSPVGYMLRPSDFWKDFQVQVLSKDKTVTPLDSTGEPTYACDGDGGCILTGAILRFEFRAEKFTSDDVTVQVTPPEGDPVPVEFDLNTIR